DESGYHPRVGRLIGGPRLLDLDVEPPHQWDRPGLSHDVHRLLGRLVAPVVRLAPEVARRAVARGPGGIDGGVGARGGVDVEVDGAARAGPRPLAVKARVGRVGQPVVDPDY